MRAFGITLLISPATACSRDDLPRENTTERLDRRARLKSADQFDRGHSFLGELAPRWKMMADSGRIFAAAASCRGSVLRSTLNGYGWRIPHRASKWKKRRG